MRFFRFVIILLSGFLHYHIYHHLAFLIGSIIIIYAGRRLVGSRPTVRGFAPQLSAQNLYLMFDVQLPRSSERKYLFLSLIPPL